MDGGDRFAVQTLRGGHDRGSVQCGRHGVTTCCLLTGEPAGNVLQRSLWVVAWLLVGAESALVASSACGCVIPALALLSRDQFRPSLPARDLLVRVGACWSPSAVRCAASPNSGQWSNGPVRSNGDAAPCPLPSPLALVSCGRLDRQVREVL